jgi:hypothetical protein
MKLYGIFDKNKNYQLIRYSTDEQVDSVYQAFDYPTKTSYEIREVCLPNIEYSESYIGKYYNSNTDTFSENPLN